MEDREDHSFHQPLTTKRLLLRQMESGDAEALHSFKSDPDVTRLYAEEPYHSIEQTRSWVQACIGGSRSREVLAWTLVSRATEQPIGMVCFWNIDHGHRRAEIGYELNPDCWHKGLMTEALTSIIDHGFQKLGFHRIEATPLVINEASQRLLERCGFRKEGVLRHRLLFQDRFLDEAYYGLLREDWMERGRAGNMEEQRKAGGPKLIVNHLSQDDGTGLGLS